MLVSAMNPCPILSPAICSQLHLQLTLDQPLSEDQRSAAGSHRCPFGAPRVEFEKLADRQAGEESRAIRDRVQQARMISSSASSRHDSHQCRYGTGRSGNPRGARWYRRRDDALGSAAIESFGAFVSMSGIEAVARLPTWLDRRRASESHCGSAAVPAEADSCLSGHRLISAGGVSRHEEQA